MNNTVTVGKAKKMTKQERTLKNALTVGELIEQLQDYDPNGKVVFSYNYGDYCHTVAASPVQLVETDNLYYSDNLRTLAVASYDDADEDEELVQAIVIS